MKQITIYLPDTLAKDATITFIEGKSPSFKKEGKVEYVQRIIWDNQGAWCKVYTKEGKTITYAGMPFVAVVDNPSY